MDDACATMDSKKWKFLEDLFDEFSIKPIVAVVPNNTDEYLKCQDDDPEFWNKVLSWQSKGWSIAMHGYKHDMHYTDAKLVLPFYKRSEFAGLSYEEQAIKIKKSYQIFRNFNIEPIIWIAPAHCFDRKTLQAIQDETPIRVISDGIAFNQYYEDSFYWLPHQLWHFKEKNSGLWTICLHPNEMSVEDLESFRETLSLYADRVVPYDNIILQKKDKSIFDIFFNFYFWRRYKLQNILYKIKSLLSNA